MTTGKRDQQWSTLLSNLKAARGSRGFDAGLDIKKRRITLSEGVAEFVAAVDRLMTTLAP
ncbi:MAG: hypothetical protein NZM29_01360 [Nitrospira sp.]|nr:hypothetical protein [Nitrospira sp.]